jgi:hypothetical protein
MDAYDPLVLICVSTLNRVMFADPSGGGQMLVLERKATLLGDAVQKLVWVRAQPFGRAVRILDLEEVYKLCEWRFDSPRSQIQQDFRILVPPSCWPTLREFCLGHLANLEDQVLDAGPQREVSEELSHVLQADLAPEQYRVQPAGFVIEKFPSPSENVNTSGYFTFHIYRIFVITVVDEKVVLKLQASSSVRDADLQLQALADAENEGEGSAHAALTLPVERVIEAYMAAPPEDRYATIRIDGCTIDPSTAAILPEVHIPQFERIEDEYTL